MKKALILFLAAMLLLTAACSGGAIDRLEKDGYTFKKDSVVNNTGSTEVNVFTWGEYMNEDLNAAFEYATGIKVNFNTFQTNEMLYSTLKSGGSSYDVICPSDYMIGQLIEEGLLEKLNFANIPNAADINPELLNPVYDPENLYSVPYAWGTVGIVYNTTMIEGAVDSWSVLFDERYSGNILMFENPRDAIGIALKMLGYSFNTTNTDELNEAYNLLRAQKPLVQMYLMDQIFDKMEGGEAAVGPYYAGDAITMMENNPDLAFAIPKEGTNLFVDAFCIPKDAKNKAAAEMYINFMCTVQAGLANIDVNGYSTPLMSVYDELDDDVKNDGISYPDRENELFETFANLPKETREVYSSLWTDLLK